MKGYTKENALIEAGYKPSSAKVNHKQVFGRADVQAEIKRRMDKMVERNALSEDWIIQRLMKIADADLGEMLEVDEEGNAKFNFNKLTPELKYALSSFQSELGKIGRGEAAQRVLKNKVGLIDKLRALELLGKKLGMFAERHVIDADAGLIEKLTAGRKRLQLEEDDAS